jgi:hypothetical protein
VLTPPPARVNERTARIASIRPPDIEAYPYGSFESSYNSGGHLTNLDLDYFPFPINTQSVQQPHHNAATPDISPVFHREHPYERYESFNTRGAVGTISHQEWRRTSQGPSLVLNQGHEAFEYGDGESFESGSSPPEVPEKDEHLRVQTRF